MDFNDTAQEAAFRTEVQTWLTANIPSEAELQDLDYIQRAKLWQKRKYEAGWACIRWPKAHGGRDASAIEQVIFNQEEAKFDTPDGIFSIGQGMCAPSMLTWATVDLIGLFMPPLASG